MADPEQVIGRGWATVELARAAVERRADLAEGATFEAAPRSVLLGATCLRGPAADGQGWIVLLEPDTEGRISGYLARHGEGWAATWADAAEASREPSPTAAPGPLGSEAMDRSRPEPRWGPYRLRVAPATIER